MAPNKLVETILRGGRFSPTDVGAPREVIFTLEAYCNLQCAHCCWPHDLTKNTWRDWSSHLALISSWPDVYPVYAGRIITKRAGAVIADLTRRLGRKIEVVDHGYTITKHPELYPHYGMINISIDGVDEDHDRQRGKSGAAKVAWQAVHELRRCGKQPVISACLSPLNVDRWPAFEKRCWYEERIGLSCAPVYPFAPTSDRGMLLFSPEELRAAMTMLFKGVPKQVRLYHKDDMRALLPIVERLEWRMAENGQTLEARIATGLEYSQDSTLIYSPLCLQQMTERQLLWDGHWYLPENTKLGDDPRLRSEEIAEVSNRSLDSERDLIQHLLRKECR